MEPIQAALMSEGHLDQHLLADLGRQSLKNYLQGASSDVNLEDVALLWQRLVGSAVSKISTEKYLTAACNCVSVFLINAHTSTLDGVRAFSATKLVWLEGYSCAQHTFRCGRPKPALQVLETLAHLLNEHSDKQIASSLLVQSAGSMIDVVLMDYPQGELKSACVSLTCLLKKAALLPILNTVVLERLQKRSVSWGHRCILNNVSRAYSTDDNTGIGNLFLALLFAINSLETRSAALKLFALLCCSPTTKGDRPVGKAAQVLEYYLHHNHASLGDFAANVLPVIIDNKGTFEDFMTLYSPTYRCAESRIILYLAVLKVGRLKSFISENGLIVSD